MTCSALPPPHQPPVPPFPGPRVLGLDISLTSTGVALNTSHAEALRTKARGHARLRWLRTEIRLRTDGADFAVVEGPAYGHGAQAGHHEGAGLWWMVTHDLWRRDIPYAVVSPHARTIYATGRANPAQDQQPKSQRARIAKGMVREAVRTRYGLECEGPGRYDQADATILAAMGLDWLGWAVVDLPASHRRALDSVEWPQDRPPAAR
jgi:hypothetical protein